MAPEVVEEHRLVGWEAAVDTCMPASAKPSKTTTTTVATTTTTLPPLPTFSAATTACISQALAAKAACTSPTVTCQAQYYVAFTNCFAPGSGVTCATTLTALARIVQNPVL